MNRYAISLAALAASLALVAPVAAQNAPQDPGADASQQQGVPQQTDTETGAQTPTQDEAAAQGDIVVTAQRTSSLASKTPVALSAIDGDALLSTGVTNPTRLEEQVPNLSIVRNNGLQITIRGVSSSDNTEKGDPSAAFLLDGVYLARPQAQEVSFFDIARVEVLRGPQGTLYGRNTTAGLINVITNKPVYEFQATANLIYGNYDTITGDAIVNLPVNDVVALRFAGSYDRRDSYLTQNVGTARDLNPFKNNYSGRAQALFTLSPDLTVLIRGDYSAIRGNQFSTVRNAGNYYAPLPAGAPAFTDQRYTGSAFSSEKLRRINYALVVAPRQQSSSWGVDGELNWSLGGLAVTYLGSYREFDPELNTSVFQGIAVRSLSTGLFEQMSHELRVATDGTGPLKVQAGGYYFREDSDNSLTLFNLLPGFPFYRFLQGPTKSETIGAFVQATYSLTDRLRATGGARYSRDDKSRIGGIYQQRTATYNPATDVFSPNNADVTFDKVTWRAGLDYDLDTRSLLYGVVSTGYKAGGFNGGCTAGTPNCTAPQSADVLFYEPETLTSYEIGLKTRLAGNALRLNASAFYYDYKNLQVSSIQDIGGAPRTFTDNAAAATVKGVELEATLVPSPRNRVDVQFTYLDAEYDNYRPLGAASPLDFEGRALDRAPRIVVAAGYTYTLPLGNGGGLAASVRSRLSDEYFITAQAVGRQYRQPSFNRADLTLRYDAPDDGFYLQGFWRNIEDNVVVTSAAFTGGSVLVAPSDPTTYGIQAGFRFCSRRDHAEVFDVVVIGGGSGGAAAAGRLSENSSLSVCVLEAGGANDDWHIRTPGMVAALPPRANWAYDTVPQPGLGPSRPPRPASSAPSALRSPRQTLHALSVYLCPFYVLPPCRLRISVITNSSRT